MRNTKFHGWEKHVRISEPQIPCHNSDEQKTNKWASPQCFLRLTSHAIRCFFVFQVRYVFDAVDDALNPHYEGLVRRYAGR